MNTYNLEHALTVTRVFTMRQKRTNYEVHEHLNPGQDLKLGWWYSGGSSDLTPLYITCLVKSLLVWLLEISYPKQQMYFISQIKKKQYYSNKPNYIITFLSLLCYLIRCIVTWLHSSVVLLQASQARPCLDCFNHVMSGARAKHSTKNTSWRVTRRWDAVNIVTTLSKENFCRVVVVLASVVGGLSGVTITHF